MKRWTFSISADGDRLSDARMKLLVDKRIDTTPMSVKEEGFVHPDGRVLPCDVPPKGYTLRIEPRKKDGEYVTCYIANPDDSRDDADTVATFKPELEWINNEWKPLR